MNEYNPGLNHASFLLLAAGSVFSGGSGPCHADLAVRSPGISSRTLGGTGSRPRPFPKEDSGDGAVHRLLSDSVPPTQDPGTPGRCLREQLGTLNVQLPSWIGSPDWLQCNNDWFGVFLFVFKNFILGQLET